jgi:hypothetical protein
LYLRDLLYPAQSAAMPRRYPTKGKCACAGIQHPAPPSSTHHEGERIAVGRNPSAQTLDTPERLQGVISAACRCSCPSFTPGTTNVCFVQEAIHQARARSKLASNFLDNLKPSDSRSEWRIREVLFVAPSISQQISRPTSRHASTGTFRMR